eukprot:2722296-Alexandrium_andersonii.AAC.2
MRPSNWWASSWSAGGTCPTIGGRLPPRGSWCWALRAKRDLRAGSRIAAPGSREAGRPMVGGRALVSPE